MKQGAFFLASLCLFFLNSCNHLFYHPSDKTFQPTPDELSLSKRDIFFTAKDHVSLHGWFFPHPRAKGTVVQFHGNAENISSHYMGLVWLVKHGYNLFTFDYRGYGRSLRTSITPDGIRQDGLAALQKALEIHKKVAPKGKFIIVGQSLGGAVALKAVEDLGKPNRIDLLVLDSSFVSYQKVAFKKLASHWPTWIFAPLAFLIVSDRTSAQNSLTSLSIPLLVVHAEHDPVIPFSLGQTIYEQAKVQQKWLWKVSGHGHIASFHLPFWQKKFLDFIDQTVQKAAPSDEKPY